MTGLGALWAILTTLKRVGFLGGGGENPGNFKKRLNAITFDAGLRS